MTQPGYGHMRASDAERERAVDVLKAAFTEGRLDQEEYTERVGQVHVSQTYGDLADLTRDLPIGPFGSLPPPPAPAYPPYPPYPPAVPYRGYPPALASAPSLAYPPHYPPYPPGGPYAPAPYFQPGPYQTGPYQTGPYPTGPFQAGPFRPSPWPTAPDQTGPYQTGPGYPTAAINSSGYLPATVYGPVYPPSSVYAPVYGPSYPPLGSHQPGPPFVVPQQRDALAVTSLAVALSAVAFPPAAFAAVGLGIAALLRIRQTGKLGRNFAMAGIALGAIGTLILIAFIIPALPGG
jgi:hypothetical protein